MKTGSRFQARSRFHLRHMHFGDIHETDNPYEEKKVDICPACLQYADIELQQKEIIMFTGSSQVVPLSEKRIRQVLAMRVDVVLIVFFSASWCLLQWALATEYFFMAEGITRQFVEFEALACAIVAACALLHLAANAAGWFSTAARMRRQSSHTAIKHGVSRRGALV